jgi:uncharacterized membrane protein
MAEHHLELPRPLRLARTVAWNLTESVGLPVAALVLGAWLGGRNAGLLAGLGAVWLTALIRKIATGSVPGLVIIMTIVLSIQTAIAVGTGSLWIFLLHFPLANLALFVLFVRTVRSSRPLCEQLAAEVIALKQPATRVPGLHRFFQEVTLLWALVFLVLGGALGALLALETVPAFLLYSSVATVALIVVGVAISLLWFRLVLRKLGVGVRFAPAA